MNHESGRWCLKIIFALGLHSITWMSTQRCRRNWFYSGCWSIQLRISTGKNKDNTKLIQILGVKYFPAQSHRFLAVLKNFNSTAAFRWTFIPLRMPAHLSCTGAAPNYGGNTVWNKGFLILLGVRDIWLNLIYWIRMYQHKTWINFLYNILLSHQVCVLSKIGQ